MILLVLPSDRWTCKRWLSISFKSRCTCGKRFCSFTSEADRKWFGSPYLSQRKSLCHRRRCIKYFPMSGIWDFKVTSVSCWRYWFLFLKLSYLSKHGSVFHWRQLNFFPFSFAFVLLSSIEWCFIIHPPICIATSLKYTQTFKTIIIFKKWKE